MRLIDADMLAKFMAATIDHHIKSSNSLWIAKEDMIKVIENARTIDAAPVVHAHWVHDGKIFEHGNDWYHCSNCGMVEVSTSLSRYQYCKKCGAKMDGEPNGDGA